MEKVREWLRNPICSGGERLYIELGDNDFLKDVFRGGESQYTRRKLFEELSKMANSHQASSYEDTPVKSPLIDNTFLLTKLRKEREQVYRQIDANMFALRKARSEASRKEHAFQILRLQRRKQEILDNIDHLELHGSLPEAPKKKEYVTPEIQRLYVQIWKARKRLERTDLRNRERTEKLLKEKLSLLDQLRKEAAYV